METGFEHLSRDARIRRLGELASKAITLLYLDEMTGKEQEARRMLEEKKTGGIPAKKMTALCVDSRMIVAFIKRVGPSSPKDITENLAMHRKTVYRRLKDLVTMDVVERIGTTRSVRYRIKSDGLVPNVPKNADRLLSNTERKSA